jgi:hypothetical protein
MCYPPKTMTRYTQQHGQNYEKRVDITTYNMVYYLVSYENYIMVNVQMKIEFSKNSQIFFPRRDK